MDDCRFKTIFFPWKYLGSTDYQEKALEDSVIGLLILLDSDVADIRIRIRGYPHENLTSASALKRVRMRMSKTLRFFRIQPENLSVFHSLE